MVTDLPMKNKKELIDICCRYIGVGNAIIKAA